MGVSLDESWMIRSLGATEQFTDSCMVHRNLNVATAVSLRIKSKITFEDTEKALKLLQNDHLQLQACIKRRSEIPPKGWSINPLNWFRAPTPIPKPEFWSLPKDKIKTPLQWITVKDLNWQKNVLEAALQTTYEEGSLLWRAFWIENVSFDIAVQETRGTLILCFHPAVTDMKGTFIYVDEFLGYLEHVLRNDIIATTTENPKIHETMESMVETPAFSRMDTLEFVGMMFSFMSPRRSPYFIPNSKPIVPDFTTRYIKIAISTEDCSSILKSIESHGVSLRAMITAAAAGAMYEILDLNDVVKFWVTLEANLRLQCKEYDAKKGRIHGNCCTYVEDTVQTARMANANEFWNLVSTVHDSTNKLLQSDFPIKMSKFCYEKMASPYQFFSNLGSASTARNDFAVAVHEDLDGFIESRDSFQVDELLAAVSAHNMGSPFKHNASVYKGKIYYTIVYCTNFVEQFQALKFGQKTLDIMKKFSKN